MTVGWTHAERSCSAASLSTTRPSQPNGGTGLAVSTIVEYATRQRPGWLSLACIVSVHPEARPGEIALVVLFGATPRRLR